MHGTVADVISAVAMMADVTRSVSRSRFAALAACRHLQV